MVGTFDILLCLMKYTQNENRNNPKGNKNKSYETLKMSGAKDIRCINTFSINYVGTSPLVFRCHARSNVSAHFRLVNELALTRYRNV